MGSLMLPVWLVQLDRVGTPDAGTAPHARPSVVTQAVCDAGVSLSCQTWTPWSQGLRVPPRPHPQQPYVGGGGL